MNARNPRDGVAQVNELFRQTDAHAAPPIGGPPRPPIDRVRRRRRRRIGLLVTAIVIVVAVALGGTYVGLTLNAPISATSAAATFHRPEVQAGPAAKLAMPPEGESAVSISGADDYLGASANSSAGGDAAVPIASISKLITAMVVLNAKPLSSATDAGPTLTFDKADHALYDKYYVLNATIATMPTNSTMSEHDALSTMLVVSACNYAEAVSDWAFGSQAGYLSATKKWLATNGMTHTRIVESTGIDPSNVSSPSDLLILGKLAMANPAIAAIVAQSSLQIPNINPTNGTNDLLGTDGVNGIKTGTLDASGSDLLFSASLPVGTSTNLDVVGVVLGGYTHESVDLDVKALLESIRSGFHAVSVATLDQSVGTFTAPWGSRSTMVIDQGASLLSYSDTPITSTMTAPKLTKGVAGEKVASITFTAGKQTVTVPVVLRSTIPPPRKQWRLTHPKQLLPWWPF